MELFVSVWVTIQSKNYIFTITQYIYTYRYTHNQNKSFMTYGVLTSVEVI